MELKTTVSISFIIYLLGSAGFYIFRGLEEALWFGIGGGLVLVNLFFALWTVKIGMKSAKNKAVFLGILLLKSMTFLMVVVVILMFLKPILLPFTLGIGVVIVGAVGAALLEVGPLIKKSN